MRPTDIDRKLFNVPHYNIIAKQFRTRLTLYNQQPDYLHKEIRAVLVELALSLALRFSADNSEFQAERFLDRCSPDSEKYPISELWDNYFIEHKAELFNA